jgi:hypothetical protein
VKWALIGCRRFLLLDRETMLREKWGMEPPAPAHNLTTEHMQALAR